MKRLAFGVLALGLLGLAGLAGLTLWVRHEVRQTAAQACLDARMDYPRQRDQALISIIQDEKRSFSERNRAVWALGYVGDSRALTTLEQLHAPTLACDHAHALCQYEINKAITKLQDRPPLVVMIGR